MSYIWVYDTPLIETLEKYSGNASFIGWSKNKETTSGYTTVKNFGSFTDVNNYIQQQINVFINAFSDGEKNKFNKTMIQRYFDIMSMQMSFFNIMNTLLKTYYGRDYNGIIKLHNDYYDKHKIVQNGLDEINGTARSTKYSTNVLLDSTVYSTVLWTVLAICLLYYVFIKL